MRRCSLCGGTPRIDEPLRSLAVSTDQSGSVIVQAGVEYHTACPACHARIHGEAPPPAKVYPRGRPVPSDPRNAGADLPICGLCRRSLYEGEKHELIRLTPSDVAGTEYADLVDEPAGLFPACTECTDRFRPAVAARLRAAGVIGPEAPVGFARGRMLS